MPFNIPETAAVIVNRIKTDIQREIAASNPFLRNSWLGALATGFANRIFDLYFTFTQGLLEALPDTALVFLERWAAIFGIIRLAATPASGVLMVRGTLAGVVVPNLHEYTSSDGEVYLVQGNTTVTATAVTVPGGGLTQTGGLATCVLNSPHFLSADAAVTISGADQTEYDLAESIDNIIVTGDNSFTYPITGSPASPATGIITVSWLTATCNVVSQGVGILTNREANERLNISSPLSNISAVGGVTFGKLAGGTEIETLDSLRLRLLLRIQNPVAHFSPADIDFQMRKVAGVTRTFIFENVPRIGAVTINFTRDEDPDGSIPTAPEVTTVKNKILEIKPATTVDGDVIVAAPVPIATAFTFTAGQLSPDTPGLRTAIRANLQAFYKTGTTVGSDVDEDAYRSAIFNSVDTVNGDRVLSFTLMVPSGDIPIAAGELGQLGVVTFL